MLVALVRVEAPEFPWRPEALSNCGPGIWKSPAYARYVSWQNANQPESHWQFHSNVLLHHDKLGMVVLDILKDNRLGGIEFVDRI